MLIVVSQISQRYGIRAIGLAPGGIKGTVGGPGGRVFGNNENKASTDNVCTLHLHAFRNNKNSFPVTIISPVLLAALASQGDQVWRVQCRSDP